MTKNSRLVYSTGEMSPEEPQPKVSNPKKEVQTARIHLDRKGRKGKSVTVVDGLSVNPTHLAEMAKTLKQKLGTGGTAKQGRIEIQGDHRQKVAELMKEMGFKIKFVGG